MIATLPRLIVRDPAYYRYSQMVHCDFLIMQSSCYYCTHHDEWTATFGYDECVAKYHCRNGYYFWTTLDNTHYAEIDAAESPTFPGEPAFVAAPLTRSVKVGGLYRYVQLFTSNWPNVRCNSMCYYYGDKVANHTSTEKCGQSHGCGLCGGFFELLKFGHSVINRQLSYANEAGQH